MWAGLHRVMCPAIDGVVEWFIAGPRNMRPVGGEIVFAKGRSGAEMNRRARCMHQASELTTLS